VWNFLETYLRPFGVMTGSDMQGKLQCLLCGKHDRQ
jgi:hypothetical protein